MSLEKFKNLDRGYMLLDEAEYIVDEEEPIKPTFFIKDNNYNLSKLKGMKNVSCRGTIFEAEGKYFLCIMFKFNDNDDLIYCDWYSYYDEEDRAKLDKLLFSEYIVLNFVNDKNEEYKCFLIENAFKNTVVQYAMKCKNGTCTTEEYHRLVEEICAKYKDRSDMFDDADYMG